MIIWGWRGVSTTGKSGEFHCPGCDTERSYRMKKIQRFFTLYFIPLIPLEVLQQSVECQTCRKNYVTAALDYNPKADREALRQEIADRYQRLLYHFGAMSGRRDPEFAQMVAHLFADLDGGSVTPDEVIQGLQRNTQNLGPALADLARNLSERGRETVVRNALVAATADGALTDDKRAELTEVAKTLGMTDTHIVGVLASWRNPALPQDA
jgi:hypothetical protein